MSIEEEVYSAINNILEYRFPSILEQSIMPYVLQAGGTMKGIEEGTLRWSIPDTPNNTYTYQSTATEQIVGYRKRDGTYVRGHERQVQPIHVAIDDTDKDIDAAIEAGVDMLVTTIKGQLQMGGYETW